MILLLTLSQAPIVLFLSYIYLKDKNDTEPLKLLFKTFLSGILVAFPILLVEFIFQFAIPLVPFGKFGIVFVEAVFGIALVEEGFKYLAVKKVAYRHAEFNEPYDGIMYAVVASLGFASIENIFYVLPQGLSTGILRMFTAVPLHAMCGVMMGFYIGLAKFTADPKKAKGYLVIAVLAPTIAHGLYDYFLMVDTNALIPLAAFILVVQLILTKKAISLYNRKPKVEPVLSPLSHPEFDSLLTNKIRWSTIPLRLTALLALFWAFVLQTGLVKPADILGETPIPVEAIPGVLIVIGIVSLVVARDLKRQRLGAWRFSFVLFGLMLPTPLFALGLAGLYGLLIPESRRQFFPLTPTPAIPA